MSLSESDWKIRWRLGCCPSDSTMNFLYPLAENLDAGPFDLVEVVYSPGLSANLILVKMEVRGVPYSYMLPEPDIENLRYAPKWMAHVIEVEALKAEQRDRERRGTQRLRGGSGASQAPAAENREGAYDGIGEP